jgi:hypothetical protein
MVGHGAIFDCRRVIGGGEGARTPDLRLAKPALCQTELHPHCIPGKPPLRSPPRALDPGGFGQKGFGGPE